MATTALLGVPYGLAWVLLGYDLLAVGNPYPVSATAAATDD